MRVPRPRALLVACTGLLILFAGCDGGSLHPLDTAVAESYIDLLRTGHINQVQDNMSLDLRYAEPRDQLVAMAALFPTLDPVSIKVIGANTFTAPDLRSTTFTLEYQFPNKWLLAGVTTQEAEGARTITALSVTPIPDSLEHTNRFSLWGKTELEYDALALAILSILFSLYAFVVCLTSNIRTGKWFWLGITLIGIGGVDINWTTGEYALSPWIFRVPPAGGSAPVYGPAILYVALPLGALVFLALRKRLTDPKADRHDDLRHYEQPPFGLPLLWHRPSDSLGANRQHR